MHHLAAANLQLSEHTFEFKSTHSTALAVSNPGHSTYYDAAAELLRRACKSPVCLPCNIQCLSRKLQNNFRKCSARASRLLGEKKTTNSKIWCRCSLGSC